LNRLHRLARIHNYIQNNLLQLHHICLYGGNSLVESSFDFNPILLQINSQNRQNSLDEAIDVDKASLAGIPFKT
jgi:hypothetical protein